MRQVPATGHLVKCGSRVPTWHRRFFVLDGDHLRYYSSAASYAQGKGLKGEMHIRSAGSSGAETHVVAWGGRVLRLKNDDPNGLLQRLLQQYQQPHSATEAVAV